MLHGGYDRTWLGSPMDWLEKVVGTAFGPLVLAFS